MIFRFQVLQLCNSVSGNLPLVKPLDPVLGRPILQPGVL